MSDQLELTLPNQRSAISGVQDQLEAFGGRNGLPGPVLYDVQLALEEHLANIVSYGYTDEETHRIRICVCLDEPDLTVEVEDDGGPFNPLAHPPPDLSIPFDERPIGGLGIHMMRKSLDGVEYRRQQGKNILLMTKRIPAD